MSGSAPVEKASVRKIERELAEHLRQIGELSEALARRRSTEVDELREPARLRARAATAIHESTLEHLVPELRSLLGVARARDAVASVLSGEPRCVLDLEEQVVAQARIVGGARRAVLDHPVLTSAEAGRRLGSSATNLRELPRQLRERSELLGLPGRRGYLYPAFQIDAERRRIHPEVADVNRTLDAAGDPWGVASWWVSKDARLDARPMDLVSTERAADLVAAARGLVDDEG